MINTVIWINSARLYQSLWCEALHDGVFSDAQVQLVSAEQEPVVDGLSHQVYAGTHHKRDDAQVDSGARQRLRASLYELEQNIAWNKIYTEMLRVENRDATAAFTKWLTDSKCSSQIADWVQVSESFDSDLDFYYKHVHKLLLQNCKSISSTLTC